ncbi:nitroreductase [Siminovitchia acidinfaciens]|uniref:Putative NAD(P)H nitroreductase n=1 Tax=Siminovitchia acidinfaciens TaxID=2321395 RepID=A0A429Y7H3_9BACI|nr:nitroreductase [Siminovitchia acidinfaciens]RST77409.1 nitroreductase [Siminovitchia acidinfaciens]
MINERDSQLRLGGYVKVLATNSIADVIRNRTTVKTGFIDKEVSQDLVLSLLEDAVWAPNHKNREPWRFIFVSGERKDAFIDAVLECQEPAKHASTRRKFEEVPAFLVTVMNADPRQKVWEEDFAATSCLLQNFQLLAWEKELGVCWKTPVHIHDPKFRSAIGVEPGEKIVGVLHIGYFDKEITARRKRERTNPAEKMTSF